MNTEKPAAGFVPDLGALVEHLPDVVWTTDARGTLVYISPNVEKLWGYTMEEIARRGLGMLQDLLHPDDAERVGAAYARLHMQRQTFDLEYRIRRPDGTWAWVRDRVLRIYERDGVSYADGTTSDITSYRQALLDRQRSEEHFRLLAETTTAAVFIQRDGKFLYFNSATELMSGYTHRQLLSMNFLELIHPDFRPLVAQRAQARINGEDVPARYEIKVLSADGATKWLEIDNRVIDFEGAPATLGTAFDITERKQRDAALRESEERFRSLIKASPDAVVVTDPRGIIEFVSERAISMFRAERATRLVGHDALSFVADMPRDEARAQLRAALDAGSTGPFESRYRLPDDSMLLCEAHVSRFRNHDGEWGGYIVTLHDISQRRAAEDRIKASLAEKEVMLREIHHRVKNNLQVITSLLSLQSRKINDEEITGYFNDSKNRVHAMSLVHQQLYQTDSLARIDFDQYIRSIGRELYRMYGTDASRIVLDVRSGGVTLNIDQAVPCGLVINELLSNALKYAFPESYTGPGRITIGLQENSVREDGARRYTLTVADNGAGIPADLDITATDTLGLQLVTLLAEGQLNGSLDLDRTDGTRFTIIIIEPAPRT